MPEQLVLKTETGSAELRTVTALVGRMRSVRAATADSSTAGEVAAKSARWCSPMPNTDSPAWSAGSTSSMTSRTRCLALTT